MSILWFHFCIARQRKNYFAALASCWVFLWTRHVFFRRTARHEHQTDAVVTSPPHWVDRAQGGCHPCSPPTCHIMQDMYSITVHLPMSHQLRHPLIQSSGFVVCWRNRRRRYETKGNTEQPPLEPAIFVKILWLWSIAVVLENDNTCPNW